MYLTTNYPNIHEFVLMDCLLVFLSAHPLPIREICEIRGKRLLLSHRTSNACVEFDLLAGVF